MSSFSLDGSRSKKRKLQDDESTSSADEGYGPSPSKKLKVSETEISQSCYYGWFLKGKDENREFLGKAKAWFEACLAKDEMFKEEMGPTYPYGREMMTKESKWQVHCTARYVGHKKKDGKKPNENEEKMLLKQSDIKVTGFVMTAGTFGAKVELSQIQENVMMKGKKPAHITIGCAKGYMPRETGSDILKSTENLESREWKANVENAKKTGKLFRFENTKKHWMIDLDSPIDIPMIYKTDAVTL